MPLIMSMSMIRYGHDSFHDFFWIVLFFQALMFSYQRFVSIGIRT